MMGCEVQGYAGLDPAKLDRLRARAIAAVEVSKLNLPLRHLVTLEDKPLGWRGWMITSQELERFAIPLGELHTLLMAYVAFENYIGKRYPNHIQDSDLRDLLVWLRHQRHGPVDAIAPAKADVSEFCWLSERVFGLCPDLAFRYFQKRELNLASVQGLAS